MMRPKLAEKKIVFVSVHLTLTTLRTDRGIYHGTFTEPSGLATISLKIITIERHFGITQNLLNVTSWTTELEQI